MSKYLTESEIRQLVQETEEEVDRRAEAAAQQRRMDAIAAFIADPKNKELIDNDPMVKQLRAMPAPTQPGVPAATRPQRPTPPPPVQRIGFSSEARNPMVTSPKADGSRPKSRAELEAERPWLRPQPKSTTLIDPYVRRKNSI